MYIYIHRHIYTRYDLFKCHECECVMGHSLFSSSDMCVGVCIYTCTCILVHKEWHVYVTSVWVCNGSLICLLSVTCVWVYVNIHTYARIYIRSDIFLWYVCECVMGHWSVYFKWHVCESMYVYIHMHIHKEWHVYVTCVWVSSGSLNRLLQVTCAWVYVYIHAYAYICIRNNMFLWHVREFVLSCWSV